MPTRLRTIRHNPDSVRLHIRSARALTQRIRMAAFPHTLGQLEAALLCLAATTRAVQMGALSRSLGIRGASLTGPVQSLQARHLVRIQIPTNDCRRKYVVITPRGRQLAAHLIQQGRAHARQTDTSFTRHLLAARQLIEQLRREALVFALGALQAHLLIELATHPLGTAHLRQALYQHLHVTPATLTQALRLLERANFIHHAPHPQRGICHHLFLTAAGRATGHHLITTMQHHLSASAAPSTP